MDADKNRLRTQAIIKRWIPLTAAIIIPWIIFYPFVTPITSHQIGIGNDFLKLYYNYKVYLLDNLIHFHIPLWSPSEGAGFPFYSSPFTQTFYPLNILLAIFYRIAGGYSPLDHMRFTVMGISIFGAGLFLWLRRMGLSIRTASAAACVIPVSFKMAEILRFPNAIHTAAWFPWLLWASSGIIHEVRITGKLKYSILFGFFTICLLTGGYPYYVVYSIFLLAPFLGLMIIPPLRRQLTGISVHRPIISIVLLFFSGSFAVAICSPYLLKMAALMQQTTDRGGASFEYSTAYLFTPLDTLGSLIFPPSASAEGWYYIGTVALLVILFFLLAPAPQPAIPGQGWRGRLIILLWIGLISWITYGRDSVLFRWLWDNVPYFSSLRAWGRMNIILLPILAWLLALSLERLITMMICPNETNPGPRKALLWVFSLASMVIIATQIFLLVTQEFNQYWRQFMRANYYFETFNFGLHPREMLFIACMVFAFLLLLISVYLSWRKGGLSIQLAWAPAIVLVLFSSADLVVNRYGTWLTWPHSAGRSYLMTSKLNRQSFETPRILSNSTIPLSASFNVGVLPNWYFERYNRFMTWSDSQVDERKILLGMVDGRRFFFTDKTDYDSIDSFLMDDAKNETKYTIDYYDGDRLVLTLNVPQTGYFSFIDNYDPDWHAKIDGRETMIITLFGTFKCISVPAGSHVVEFTYTTGR